MTVRGLSMRLGCAAAALALLVGGALAQDAGTDLEYEPGEGYHEEEWYDPSDWFDDDDGVDYEYDDTYGSNGSDYDDGYGDYGYDEHDYGDDFYTGNGWDYDNYGEDDYGYSGDIYDYWDYYDSEELTANEDEWWEDGYESGYGGEYRNDFGNYYTDDWYGPQGVFDGWYQDAF